MFTSNFCPKMHWVEEHETYRVFALKNVEGFNFNGLKLMVMASGWCVNFQHFAHFYGKWFDLMEGNSWRFARKIFRRWLALVLSLIFVFCYCLLFNFFEPHVSHQHEAYRLFCFVKHEGIQFQWTEINGYGKWLMCEFQTFCTFLWQMVWADGRQQLNICTQDF